MHNHHENFDGNNDIDTVTDRKVRFRTTEIGGSSHARYASRRQSAPAKTLSPPPAETPSSKKKPAPKPSLPTVVLHNAKVAVAAAKKGDVKTANDAFGKSYAALGAVHKLPVPTDRSSIDSDKILMRRGVVLHKLNKTVEAAGAHVNEANAKAEAARVAALRTTRGQLSIDQWKDVTREAAKITGYSPAVADSSALQSIIRRESNFNTSADNPTSTAYGLAQFLDSTWAGVGMVRSPDPVDQMVAALKYINGRYGSPEKALAFHHANGYY